MERKKIPKIIKDSVAIRQKNKCACCLERGTVYHHLVAYSKQKIHSEKNLFLLCEKHHELFHLGDPETYQTLYEYAWYVQKGKLPSEEDLSTISSEIHGIIEKQQKDFKELSKKD